MMAVVYSRDKVSTEVLERTLVANGFARVLVRESPEGELPEEDEVVVFLDMDDQTFAGMPLHLPGGTVMVPFGSYEAWQRLASESTARFLVKPFTREHVERVTREILLQDAALSPPRKHRAEGDREGLREDLVTALKRVAARRQSLVARLSATPEQLKQLMAKSAVPGEDGRAQLPTDALPFMTALVVDGDETFARLVSRYLSNKCVLQVDLVADGEAAWRSVRQSKYDLIVLEWETAKLSGLALYNRLRAVDATRYVPVLVTSKQLKAADFRLLDEDFAASLLPKPATEKAFFQALEVVGANAIVAREDQTEMVEIARRLAEAGVTGRELGGWLAGPADPLLLNALRVAGEELAAKERYGVAEAAFAVAWGLGDRRVSLLTGYGRACHLAGNHRRARQLLATADILAPRNVERLCLLGEVDLHLSHPDKARERFQAALAVDGGVKKAKAGIHVADALSQRGERPVPLAVDRFASYLNLVGIELSQSGKTAEAVQYYNSAMVFVRQPDDLIKLWFNVGLCYRRARQPQLAIDAFNQAYMLSGGTFERAARYVRSETPRGEEQEEIPFERI